MRSAVRSSTEVYQTTLPSFLAASTISGVIGVGAGAAACACRPIRLAARPAISARKRPLVLDIPSSLKSGAMKG